MTTSAKKQATCMVEFEVFAFALKNLVPCLASVTNAMILFSRIKHLCPTQSALLQPGQPDKRKLVSLAPPAQSATTFTSSFSSSTSLELPPGRAPGWSGDECGDISCTANIQRMRRITGFLLTASCFASLLYLHPWVDQLKVPQKNTPLTCKDPIQQDIFG